MPSSFLPQVDSDILKQAIAANDDERLYELLVEPLHEELYKRQDFDFLDELSDGQQLILSYDYLRNQAGQGGFIQFIQNGYVSLLPNMPEWLDNMELEDMAQLLDDVLKVYVYNHELMDKQTTPEEFAKLYDELKEFEILDERFVALNDQTVHVMMRYAKDHLDEFVTQLP